MRLTPGDRLATKFADQTAGFWDFGVTTSLAGVMVGTPHQAASAVRPVELVGALRPEPWLTASQLAMQRQDEARTMQHAIRLSKDRQQP